MQNERQGTEPIGVQLASLVDGYISPSKNPKQRQKIFTDLIGFCSIDGKRQLMLHSYLDEAMHAYQNKDGDTEATRRLGQYSDLKRKIERYYPPFSEMPNTTSHIPLPEASKIVSVPRESIQLVNEALQASYPEQAHLFYELQPQHVRVVSYAALAEFASEQIEAMTQATPGRRMQELLDSWGSERTAPIPYSWSMQGERPGKPIVASEPEITKVRDMRQEQLSFPLIHEDIHRVARPITLIAREYPELVDLAFSVDRFILESTEPEKRTALEEHLQWMQEYVANNPSYIVITGAHMTLVAREGDKYHLVTQAGYDTNEALVECLADAPKDKVAEVVKKKYPEGAYFLVKQNTESQRGAQGSYKLQNLYPKIDELMSKLGLNSKEEIMEAYIFGRIPFLWLQNRPSAETYY